MTVHGAKGLEAPVVILPDTTRIGGGGGGGGSFDLGDVPAGGFYVRPSQKDAPEILLAENEKVKTADYQEYLRRFYVALTRAETRLIICGYQSGRFGSNLTENCWYDWASRAFAHLGDKAGAEFIAQYEDPIAVFGPSQTGQSAPKDAREDYPLPPWATKPAPAADGDRRYVTPSHLLAGATVAGPALASPLEALAQSSGPDPFARGVAIHKLLEILPDVAPARRAEVAKKYLSANAGLETAMAERIFEEVFTVLDAPQFADLFAPGSRAEVSLAGGASGLPKDVFLNAQIDRLAVSEKDVWIVDYKSNRPPPDTPDEVAPIYIAQMAAYRALAQDIYPKKTVRCALLWTDAPRLMELPAALLDSFDLRAAVT